jgi:hypothetical protein
MSMITSLKEFDIRDKSSWNDITPAELKEVAYCPLVSGLVQQISKFDEYIVIIDGGSKIIDARQQTN